MQKLSAAIIILFMVISPAFAFNLSFLSYSPVYYFTQSDWAIAESTAQKVLNSTKDNAKVTWRNPQTNTSGYFIPFNTTTQNGTKCRKMKIFSKANEVTGESIYQFCKVNGDWKIAG